MMLTLLVTLLPFLELLSSQSTCISSPICVDPNLPIPDEGFVTSSIITNSSLIPETNPRITSVSVYLKGIHSWVQDITVTLSLQNGNITELWSAQGFLENGFDLVISDSGVSTVSDVDLDCMCVVQAENGRSLNSAFSDYRPIGNWSIQISDSTIGDTGTLQQWCLQTLCYDYDTISPTLSPTVCVSCTQHFRNYNNSIAFSNGSYVKLRTTISDTLDPMPINVMYTTMLTRDCINPAITIVLASTDYDLPEEFVTIFIDEVSLGICDPNAFGSCNFDYMCLNSHVLGYDLLIDDILEIKFVPNGNNINFDGCGSYIFAAEITIRCDETQTNDPTLMPSNNPTIIPSENPSSMPSNLPTENPSNIPSNLPTKNPSNIPTFQPSVVPSENPSNIPSNLPSKYPTSQSQTFDPSQNPSDNPSIIPTNYPSKMPSISPTLTPNEITSNIPTIFPTETPSKFDSSTKKDNKNNFNIIRIIIYVGGSFLGVLCLLLIGYKIGVVSSKKNESKNNKNRIKENIELQNLDITDLEPLENENNTKSIKSNTENIITSTENDTITPMDPNDTTQSPDIDANTKAIDLEEDDQNSSNNSDSNHSSSQLFNEAGEGQNDNNDIISNGNTTTTGGGDENINITPNTPNGNEIVNNQMTNVTPN